ncbi:MAG: acyl transferase [Chitinophagaceae bacterium]|nr:MAG: acyl transferase [Chitinophagaceae bacterium]
MNCEYEDNIFSVSEHNFEALALEVFRFQAAENAVYRQFLAALKTDMVNVKRLDQIPFLPISMFKSSQVTTGSFEPELVFESSGTTSTINSRHLVKKSAVYRESFLKTFRQFYGDPSDWCIIGLLPSYLERTTSSLVYMANDLIRLSGHPSGGFYLYDHERLRATLTGLENAGQKTMLIGVSFALLDFGATAGLTLNNCVVMETGGMKGRRAEITRPELHQLLKSYFGVTAVHSEYGMTELLSQAYSTGKGVYETPAWMKVMIREDDDPLSVNAKGKGLLNVIDLANIYSCSFIATDDIGIVNADGSFEVQGRLDNSDVRGCSLMVSDMHQ